jgi:hypothetical protein
MAPASPPALPGAAENDSPHCCPSREGMVGVRRMAEGWEVITGEQGVLVEHIGAIGGAEVNRAGKTYQAHLSGSFHP